MDEEQQRGAPRRPQGSGRRRATPPARAGKPPRIEDVADPRRSRSLEFGVAILECYAHAGPALGIAELAEIVGISRSTIHRYATTLLTLGYLEQDDKRKYRLATRAGGPGRAALETLRADVKARAVLEELRSEVGHTVSMAVLSGPRAIYLHRLFAHGRGQYAVDRAVESGASVPLHCSAVGKALLVSLPADERERLLAELDLAPAGPAAIRNRRELERALERIDPDEPVLSDEEQGAGARSLAIALPRAPGEPALAIEVTAPAAALSASRLVKHVGPPLKRAAKLICGD